MPTRTVIWFMYILLHAQFRLMKFSSDEALCSCPYNRNHNNGTWFIPADIPAICLELDDINLTMNDIGVKPQLMSLTIYGRHLELLSQNVFIGLPSITTIRMRCTNISTLPLGILPYTFQLYSFELSGSQLKHVPSFEMQWNLHLLQLNKNKLISIDSY